MAKELKIGERIVLEITETETMTCSGCFFESKDEKNVIFKEVKE